MRTLRRTEAVVPVATRRVRSASALGNRPQVQHPLVYLWPALLLTYLAVWDLGAAGFLSNFETFPHPLPTTRLRRLYLMTQLP